jgi:hypothetical protein
VPTLRDHSGRVIRLTDERLRPILDHPEMAGMEPALGETVAMPVLVVQSVSDPRVSLYHRRYDQTPAVRSGFASS